MELEEFNLAFPHICYFSEQSEQAKKSAPRMVRHYLGLMCVSCGAAIELQVKSILSEFSRTKSPELLVVYEANFEKRTGNLTISGLKDRHAAFFGKQFQTKLSKVIATLGNVQNFDPNNGLPKSITGRHDMLLLWRHKYAHGAYDGIGTDCTNENILECFEASKEVMRCFNQVFLP